LTLIRFFLYSVAVHALLIAVLLFIIPAPEEKKAGGAFFTDLVSPEELHPGKTLMPPPMSRTRPLPPARPKSVAPLRSIREKRTAQPEKGTSYDHVKRSYGETKDTSTALPSPPVSTSGEGGFSDEIRTGSEGRQGIQKPQRVGPTPREKLFDNKITDALAARNAGKDEKNKPFTFDAKEYRFLIYNKRLKERIESIWHYPPDAAAQGIYGDLIIKFTIKKNGQLGAVELIRTSGHKTLDDAAMEALRDGVPYWPLPDEWGMEGYTIEGHFVYSLYGYYIR
jgi:protein TonB